MFNTFRSELYRVFKGKMIYVFLTVTALLPLFAMLLGVSLLVDEYNAGMLKVRLLSTHRFCLYAAKALVIALSFGLLVVVYGIVSYVVGGVYYGFQMDGESLFKGILGLVLCFQTLSIVRLHGGDVTCQVLDPGVRFKITIGSSRDLR